MVTTLKQNSYVRDVDGGRNNEQDTCIPRFHLESKAVLVDGKTEFRDVEMVEIIMPGNAFSKPDILVTDVERARWPRSYEAFKDGLEPPVDGTPLEEWPVLTKSMVLTLKSMDFRTVEDLANMGETAIQRIPIGGRGLKLKAMAYIDAAASSAITNRAIESEARLMGEVNELKAQNQRLNEQLATLGDQMRHMLTQQSRAAENIATTPGLAISDAPNVTPLRASESVFARFAVDDLPTRMADTKSSIEAWKDTQTPGTYPVVPEAQPEVVNLGTQGGMPAKKRGRKSNAEKAAEAARGTG